MYNNDHTKKASVLLKNHCTLTLSIICIYQLLFNFLKHPVFVKFIPVTYYGVKMYGLS